jgi:hypothetical protein
VNAAAGLDVVLLYACFGCHVMPCWADTAPQSFRCRWVNLFNKSAKVKFVCYAAGRWLLHKETKPIAAAAAAAQDMASSEAGTVSIAAVAAEMTMVRQQPQAAAATAAAVTPAPSAAEAVLSAAFTAAATPSQQESLLLPLAATTASAATAIAAARLSSALKTADCITAVGITAVLPPSESAGTPQSLQQQRQKLEQLWQSLQYHTSQVPPQQQQQQHTHVPALARTPSNGHSSSCNPRNRHGDSSVSSNVSDSSSSNIGSGLGRRLVDSGVLSPQQLAQLQQWSVEYAPLLKGVVSAPLIAGFMAIAIGSYSPLRVSLLQCMM